MNERIKVGHRFGGEPIDIEFSKLLGIHGLNRGKTGSGKSLFWASFIMQLMFVPSVAISIIDLSGDLFVFNFLRDLCKGRKVFRFMSLDESHASSHFDIFQCCARMGGNVARIANFLAGCLGLIYQEGYGTGYYSRVNLSAIVKAVADLVRNGTPVTLISLHATLAEMARRQSRYRDAVEALYALDQLIYYPQLHPSEDPAENIDIARGIEDCECNYYYLPVLREALTARAVGSAAMWGTAFECERRIKSGAETRNMFMWVDEFAQIAGGKAVEDVLSLSRKTRCNLYISHQTSQQLVLRNADLRSIVTDNTSLRFYFTLPTKYDIDEILNHSKKVVEPRKSVTVRGLSSSVTRQDTDVPGFNENVLRDISGTFGHAVMIQELGDGHQEPVHLVCVPPVSKEKYDELANRPLPQREVPLPPTSWREGVSAEERASRGKAIMAVINSKRQQRNGWRALVDNNVEVRSS